MDAYEIYQLVNDAWSRIRPYVLYTPLLHDFRLSKNDSNQVYLKLESEQETSSFKLRGAYSKLTLMRSTDKMVVTASTGNHGLACLRAMQKLNMKGRIVVPVEVNKGKLEKLLLHEAELLHHGHDCHEGEIFARTLGDMDPDMEYVSPYNDPIIIGGQGTIAREINEQLFDLDKSPDVVFVSVGGGGLISGIAGYLKHLDKSTKIVGCQPKASAAMSESVKANRVVNVCSTPTLSDGTAGDIDMDSVTFEPCMNLVDEWVVVEEQQIEDAMKYMLKEHRKVVEGAAGLALASYLQTRHKYKGKTVVIVICGGNLDWETFQLIASQ